MEKTKKDDGGPAFPRMGEPGMSLRDWFAGKALEGMAAGNFWGDNLNDEKQMIPVALVAYQMADAMLAERKK